MSKKTRSNFQEPSINTNASYSTFEKPQGYHEDLSGRPHTITFTNVINRSCLVRGLRNAGFDIDGAQSFGSFREPKTDIVFVTRRHGKRVLEAFQGGLIMPGVSNKVIATAKFPATYDEIVDVLSRDANKPVPELENIRDFVMKAYGFPGSDQVTTEPATVTSNQQWGAEQNMKTADDETGAVTEAPEAVAQDHPPTGIKDVAYWVEDGVHFVLSREHIGKRTREPEDETDEEHSDGKGEQGTKRPRR